MEDDDDSLVTIGTAFDIPEEDEAPKKRFDKHGQVAIDSKGRRRFHGAFTGGFSAGYYNTVGTKEGWTPSTFMSSRSNRVANESSTQKPEDFMDEEDLGEHGIAPRMFMTKESFTPAEKEIAERKRAINRAIDDGILKSAVPGGLPMDGLITPSQVSIGVRLLRKMGWKEGQGVGAKQDVIKEAIPSAAPAKRIYGCSLPSTSQGENDIDINNLQHFLAPKDLQPIDFRPKDNTHGIGYSGIDPNRAMFIGSSSMSGAFKPTGTEKRGIRGQAFGIGTFEEEDDDIYNMDDMSEYDFMNTSERESGSVYNYGWSGPPRKDKGKGAIVGFNRAAIPTAINKIFRPPLLPHNFIPKHEFNSSTKPVSTVQTHASGLTSSDRALLLGERTPMRTLKSVFDIVPEKDRQKIESAKRDLENSKRFEASSKNIAGTYPQLESKTSRWDSKTKDMSDSGQSTTSQNSTLFKPFENDPSKQKRYELFLSAKKLGKDLDLKYDGSMTEWEKERETEEFSRASILYRPMSTSISSRFTRGSLNEESAVAGKKAENIVDEKSDCEKAAKLGLFGKLTRQANDWYPSALLCKRFNVPDPYPQSQFTGTIGRGRKVTSNSLSYFGSTVPIDQSKTEDYLSERDDVSSDQFAKEDTHRGSTDIGDSQEVREPMKDDFKTKVHSLQSSSATSGPLSYLNDVDKEGKSESSEGGQNPENEQKEVDTKRPLMDLFKAIFAEDSDSSEDESNNEEENIAKDDASKNTVDARGSARAITHPRTAEFMPKGNSLENKNENIVNKQKTEVHQPSFEIVASEIVDAKKSVSSNEATKPLDAETGTQCEAQKIIHPSRSTLSIKAASTNCEGDQLTMITESNKGRKGSHRKESYKEGMKKKKKEKKQKKKKKKEKKKVKMKKSRDYDKGSSSEWSSDSEDDKIASEKSNTDMHRPKLLKNDRKIEKLKKGTNYYDDMRHENPRFQETADGLSISDKTKCSSNQNKSSKQYRKSREIAVTEQDDKLSHERCRSGSFDRAKSNFMSSEIPKRSIVKSNQNEEKHKEGVPSATELYQKLKKHGLTLKRMSAADFM